MSTSTNQLLPDKSNKSGRPPSDIWEYMTKGERQSKGHYSAICSFCKRNWKQGKPHILREHLANHCKSCPKDISSYYAKIVGKKMGENDEEEESSTDETDKIIELDDEYPSKKQKLRQTSVKNFYGSKKVEIGRSDELDRVITKAFIMANIPFSVIENPWFVNMIKTLEPGYDAPSRRVLSGSLLEAELSRTNLRINNELEKESNFTIGKFIYFLLIIIIKLFY